MSPHVVRKTGVDFRKQIEPAVSNQNIAAANGSKIRISLPIKENRSVKKIHEVLCNSCNHKQRLSWSLYA
jgi:hypothetical protein